MNIYSNLSTIEKVTFTLMLLGAFSINMSITIGEWSEILLIIIMISFLYRSKINIFKDCAYVIPFAIYWFITILSVFFGSDQAHIGAKSFLQPWGLLYIFVLYYLVKNEYIKYIFTALILGAVILAISAILDVEFYGNERGGGLLSMYMTTGNILAMAATLITCLLLSSQMDKKRELLLLSIALIVIVAGVFYTGTRGALLSFSVSAIIAIVVRFKTKGVVIALFLIMAIVAVVFLTSIGDRFTDIFSGFSDPTTSHGWRIVLWTNSFTLLSEYPIFGVGPDGYEALIRELVVSIGSLPTGHAHNSFIQQLTMYGVLGFLALMYFYGKILLKLAKNILTNRYAFIGFFVTMTYFLEGLTEDNFGDSEVAIFHTIILGIALIATERKYNGNSIDRNII